MRTPQGFEMQKHPLRHKMYYAAGLSAVTTGKNTASFMVLRQYNGGTTLNTIVVNPKHTGYVRETGCIVQPNSIIDRLRIKLNFSLTEAGQAENGPIKVWWQPIFFSFGEKLDAADDDTGTTVAAILELIKDATKEDVTPLFNNIKHDVLGVSDRSHPITTINTGTETIGMLNMDTDLTSEGLTWDDELVQTAMQRYTNKGALKACLGRRRFMTLDKNHLHQSYFINKRPPRAVTRIVPYSYMAIVVHVPLVTDDDQFYFNQVLVADLAQIGVTCKIQYHEWNNEHHQESTGP